MCDTDEKTFSVGQLTQVGNTWYSAAVTVYCALCHMIHDVVKQPQFERDALAAL